MLKKDSFDWAMGELMAYGSLLTEGFGIRMSGQDVERGTFSHRHAVVKTEDDEEEVIPLNSLSENQASFQIYNSFSFLLTSPNKYHLGEYQTFPCTI